jgi:hypothetical protein
MNERDIALVRHAIKHLQPLGSELAENGWRPEIILLAPEEIQRIPGYKVALVIPLDTPLEGGVS